MCIILLIIALNDLKLMVCDIQNTYLMADCWEKIWTYAGPEFRSKRRQPMFIKKALHGLKSSGATFWAHLANMLYDIGFISTKADPDVWIHLAVKPVGTEYYEYVMCYTIENDEKSLSRPLTWLL